MNNDITDLFMCLFVFYRQMTSKKEKKTRGMYIYIRCMSSIVIVKTDETGG